MICKLLADLPSTSIFGAAMVKVNFMDGRSDLLNTVFALSRKESFALQWLGRRRSDLISYSLTDSLDSMGG